MRRTALLIGLVSIFILTGSDLEAESGTTGGATLRRLSGALPTSLGETFAAASNDINAAAYNPAGLGDLSSSQLTATYFRGLVDDDLGVVGYGQTLKWGTIYGGAGYFNAGTIDLNLSSGLQETRTAQEDVVGMVGIGLGREWPVLLGVLGKTYRFELAEEVHTSGAAFDAGLIYKTPVRGVQLGAAIQNVGSDVKFETEKDPLPTTTRYGGSVTFKLPRIPFTFQTLVDGVKEKEEETSLHTGLQISQDFETNDVKGTASLRGGYISDPNSFTIGLGFKLGYFMLDYAIKLLNDLDETHRATLGVEFGQRDR